MNWKLSFQACASTKCIFFHVTTHTNPLSLLRFSTETVPLSCECTNNIPCRWQSVILTRTSKCALRTAENIDPSVFNKSLIVERQHCTEGDWHQYVLLSDRTRREQRPPFTQSPKLSRRASLAWWEIRGKWPHTNLPWPTNQCDHNRMCEGGTTRASVLSVGQQYLGLIIEAAIANGGATCANEA